MGVNKRDVSLSLCSFCRFRRFRTLASVDGTPPPDRARNLSGLPALAGWGEVVAAYARTLCRTMRAGGLGGILQVSWRRTLL